MPAVRPRRHDARRDGALAVVVALEADAERGARVDAPPSQSASSVGIDVVDHARDVRREAHGAFELALEHRRIDDPGQRADALLPGREVESRARRRRRARACRRPASRRAAAAHPRPSGCAATRPTPGSAHRRARRRVAARAGACAQRDPQTRAREREREALADDAGALHLHVVASARPRRRSSSAL